MDCRFYSKNMKQHSKDQVEATANAIMNHFIPKDEKATTFSFHFTIPPASNYKVDYQKNEQGIWLFLGFEIDKNQA